MLTQPETTSTPGLHVARDGLSGERRGVELGRAVDDDTVDGTRSPGLTTMTEPGATSVGSTCSSSPSFSTFA